MLSKAIKIKKEFIFAVISLVIILAFTAFNCPLNTSYNANASTVPFFNVAPSAATDALRSAVSIRCAFTKNGTNTMSAGSGVVYRLNKDESTAYIITNYHVIYSSSSESGISPDIKVYLYGSEDSDGVSAKFYGGSMMHDIAILYVKLDNVDFSSVKAARIGNSNRIKAGNKVIAAGNANGGGLSVTAGIVSVESEYISMAELSGSLKVRYARVMRVDAAVNGGNSGGGLYDEDGRLIGIVNAKTVAAGVEGICYAIPEKLAVSVARSILDNEQMRCALGMEIKILSSKGVYERGNNCVTIKEELRVSNIMSGSLAEKGFKSGDKLVWVKINGAKPVELYRSFQLPELLLNVKAGDTLTFKVIREGKAKKIKLIVALKDMILIE